MICFLIIKSYFAKTLQRYTELDTYQVLGEQNKVPFNILCNKNQSFTKEEIINS